MRICILHYLCCYLGRPTCPGPLCNSSNVYFFYKWRVKVQEVGIICDCTRSNWELGAIDLLNSSNEYSLGRARGGGSAEMAIERVYCPIAWHQGKSGKILAPVTTWHNCPAAGLCGLGTFWFDDATSWSRRSYVGSDATQQRATLADEATRAAQSKRNLGRAKQTYRERVTLA